MQLLFDGIMNRTLATTRSRTDVVGMTLSILCMVHCAAVPVLAIVMPFIGIAPLAESSEEVIHILVLVATIPVTLRSVARASRSGNWRSARALIVGLTAFACAALAHDLGHLAETVLSIAGGMALLYGHTARCNCVGTSVPSSSTC